MNLGWLKAPQRKWARPPARNGPRCLREIFSSRQASATTSENKPPSTTTTDTRKAAFTAHAPDRTAVRACGELRCEQTHWNVMRLEIGDLVRYSQSVRNRAVHGSILCDPIQPNPSADWPNRTRPITSGKIWTRPNTTNKFNCLVQPDLI